MAIGEHSPGPWFYDEGRCAICYRLPAEHPGRWSTDPEMDDGVRNVVSLHGACGGTDSGADVALMMTAPTLLAILRLALPHISGRTVIYRDGPDSLRLHLREAVLAVIAKAEGRAP